MLHASWLRQEAHGLQQRGKDPSVTAAGAECQSKTMLSAGLSEVGTLVFEGERRHERLGISMLHSVRVRMWLMDSLREVGQFAEGCVCREEALRIVD